VRSFTDFERLFGGLMPDVPMTFAVRDFFQNGGAQAEIVRLFRPTSSTDSGVATITVTASGGGSSSSSAAGAALQLVASNPGAWGNDLSVEVGSTTLDADVAQKYGAATSDFFNLIVVYRAGQPDEQRETFRNLTYVTGSSRRFDRVLATESMFVRAAMSTGTGLQVTSSLPVAGSVASTPSFGGNDGTNLQQADYEGAGIPKTGLNALENADLFNLLFLPPDVAGSDIPLPLYAIAMQFCATHRAMFIADPLAAWTGPNAVATAAQQLVTLGLTGPAARNAAVYFPRLRSRNSLRGNQLEEFVPCGAIAGVMSRTDAQRGVWKAPAGIDGALVGVESFTTLLTDGENGTLNQIGLNCLRTFPIFGNVVWGARTARGADQAADEYKYVPVRRTALFIEETLYRALKWVVFEPNDEPLWSQIRLNVGAFMQDLFRQGAFQGKTPQEAYLVKCDKETTTQSDINRGVVNILVGFAPLKPAEFVVIKLQQLAGQIAT